MLWKGIVPNDLDLTDIIFCLCSREIESAMAIITRQLWPFNEPKTMTSTSLDFRLHKD
jgi:hypothetical protein